jgi:hypothetical protein
MPEWMATMFWFAALQMQLVAIRCRHILLVEQ